MPTAPLQDRFYVTKVLLTDEAAEQEASRLSALNSENDCRFVVRVTRLDERQQTAPFQAGGATLPAGTRRPVPIESGLFSG